MLVTLNDILYDAKKNHYAVGLFNTVNLEMAKGVLRAAEELRSPVIIGTAEVLLPAASLEELAYFLLPMAKKATVPVVLHYDHGLTEEKINEAIDLGFSSVMYDCSELSVAENTAAVAALVRRAHACGISVEAELGHIGSETGGDTESIYTDPEDAAVYAEATGCDALAIAIGTAHGFYKSTPKLDFERLSAIADKVDVPLVLHGGSGLSDDDFTQAIARGIAKVNIFTDINVACARCAAKSGDGAGMTDIMPELVSTVAEVAKNKMRLFGCAGKV